MSCGVVDSNDFVLFNYNNVDFFIKLTNRLFFKFYFIFVHSFSVEWQEDIKLPAKVDVEMKPADNESWYAVQSLAQNPRVKTSLPLQKRLISVIKTLQNKWKSREAKMVCQTFAL